MPAIFDGEALDEPHYVDLKAAEETARLLALEEAVLRPEHRGYTVRCSREGKDHPKRGHGCDGPGRGREVSQHPVVRRRQVT